MQAPAKIVVIKLGSGVLTHGDRVALDGEQFEKIVVAVSGVLRSGYRPVVVSSGAVAAGLMAFKMDSRPEDMATLQACAAVGQARLMHTYESLFRNFNLSVAQVLLTGEDLRTEARSTNVRNTLERLLSEEGIVPVINENDSVAVEELKVGDNDMLSANVARLVGAKRLILLTSVDGLLSPGDDALIPEVSKVDEVMGFVKDEQGKFSIGGMSSKLKAVKLAVESGIETHIANGRRPERLAAILEGQNGISTRFLAGAR
jgi:glutamate 5-kinase